MHPFESLPREILIHVATFLNAEDLVALSHTCRRWRNFLNDESVWRLKCLQHGLQLSRAMPTTSNTPWRDRFLENIRVRRTWKHPQEATVVVITERETSQRGDVIAVGCDRVLTLNDEMILKAWNPFTGEFCWERRLSSENVLLDSVILSTDVSKGTGTVISPGNGETLITWDMGLITKVAIHDDNVVSITNEGDRNNGGTLRFWDPRSKNSIAAVPIRSFFVDHLMFDGNSVIIVFSSGDIEVWNASECSLQHVYPNRHPSESRVNSLVLDEARMYVSFVESEFVRVWSFGEHHETTLVPFEKSSTLHLSEELLIGISPDNLVKVWDKETMMSLLSIDCRSSMVGVSVQSTHLVTSSSERSLEIYNLSREALRRHEVQLRMPEGYQVHEIHTEEAKIVVDVRKSDIRHKSDTLMILDFARPRTVGFDRAP